MRTVTQPYTGMPPVCQHYADTFEKFFHYKSDPTFDTLVGLFVQKYVYTEDGENCKIGS